MRAPWLRLSLSLLLATAGFAAAKEKSESFAVAAGKIKVGTAQRRVRELLGEPHEVAEGGRWSYRDPRHQPDGPYHWYLFTFARGKVSKVEQGGVGCVLRE